VDDHYHKAKTQPVNSSASNPKMTSSQNLPFTHDEPRVVPAGESQLFRDRHHRVVVAQGLQLQPAQPAHPEPVAAENPHHVDAEPATAAGRAQRDPDVGRPGGRAAGNGETIDGRRAPAVLSAHRSALPAA
jgi:hypothetical protein